MSSPKRALLIGTGSVDSNATQTKLFYFAQALQGDFDVTLLSSDSPANRELARQLGLRCELRLLAPGGAAAEFWRKQCAAVASSWDFVHLIGVGVRTLLLPRRLTGAKVLCCDFDEWMSSHTTMAPWRRRYYVALEDYILRRSDGLTIASAALRAHLCGERGYRGRTAYIPIGCDPEEQCVEPSLEADLRARSAGKALLLYVGNLHRNYQVWDLLDLAVEIKRLDLNWRILVCGGGPEHEEIQNAIASRRLDGQIHLEGRVPRRHLATYMAVADVLLFPFAPTPQNLYRCPTKTFQYAYSGKPLVTNRVGEVAEVYGDDAFYYEPGNGADFLRACRAALAGAETYAPTIDTDRLSWAARQAQYLAWVRGLCAADAAPG